MSPVSKRRRTLPGWSASALLLAAATTVTACGSPDADDSQMASFLNLDEVPRWEVREVFRMGSVEDPEAGFSGIGALFRDAEGRLYVVETQEIAIRVYSPGGELLHRIGGRGEGPGEFQGAPAAAGVFGDTVWAFDQFNRRLTLFRRSGELISSHTVEEASIPIHSPGWASEIWPLSVDAEGFFIGNRGMRRGSEGGEWRDTIRIPRIRFDGEGSIVDTAGGYDVVSRRQPAQWIDVGSSRYLVPPPPNTDPRLTLLPDEAILFERAIPGMPGAIRISRITPLGDTTSAQLLTSDPIPMPHALRDEAVSRSTRGVGTVTALVDDGIERFEHAAEDSAAARRALLAELDWPEYQPAFRDAEFTANGALWLDRELIADSLRRYTILDSDDRPEGELLLPEGTRIRLIEGDTIWTVEHDDLDIPWLIRLEIVR